MRLISAPQLQAALKLRDLADPAQGLHAMQLIVTAIETALQEAWNIPVRRDPGPRVVSVADNYNRLRYHPAAVTRDHRYTRYVTDTSMLRSHTTARIPHLLDHVTADVVLTAPGISYRRDSIDRLHTGEPHQMDAWKVGVDGDPLTGTDLTEMIGLVIGAALPGLRWRTIATEHPYTVSGREIYVSTPDGEVEVGECGLVHPQILAAAGLPESAGGLAMGLGLDRLLMIAKRVPDIRLLRSDDERVAVQMLDLSTYRPVSAMPAITRDLSLAVNAGCDEEAIGDKVRDTLGADADTVELAHVLHRTGYAQLPQAAVARMGMRPGQDNVLLRLILRHPTRTLTAAYANLLRDRIYEVLHEGTNHGGAAR